MLAMDSTMQVNLAKFRGKLNKEGAKLAKVGLRLVLDGDAAKRLKGPLSEAAKLLRQDAAVDEVGINEKLQGVRLAFKNGVGTGDETVVESTDLVDFVVSRESGAAAGTVKSERSGRLAVDFSFTTALPALGYWAVGNFGDDVDLVISKAQGELALAEGENPDSQEARNKRIVEGEKEDAEKATKKGKAKGK